ncbi:hypothetical protein C5167_014349 [Papaver somniferum]|uniref:CASP-like protein n=1 Tax=Papaver somniferum TaxID=3469 RepID=A0A4Y7J3V8_PAPSO|nr:CASP-like protein 1D1 [Papaver somniferum]RZC55497.1 hypothetical protein C5167_014349 [Papaver somniferum]
MSTEEVVAKDTATVETGGVSNDTGSDASSLSLTAGLAVRKLLFWTVFVAAIVVHTSKQTVDGLSDGSKTTKYTNYPAYKYLLSVLWIVCGYTFIASINSAICGRSGNKYFILSLLMWDAMILTLMASATGTAGAVLFIGTKGNSHDGWSKTCNVFDKFCRHMWASFGLSIFACFLLVWIIVYSAGAIKTA